MVIFASFSNVIGTVPYSIVYILDHSIMTQAEIGYLFDITLAFLNTTIALDLFVYYLFNKLFRDVLKGYFNSFVQFFVKTFNF